MKSIQKKLVNALAALGCAGLSLSAQAASIGGVTWPLPNGTVFSAVADASVMWFEKGATADAGPNVTTTPGELTLPPSAAQLAAGANVVLEGAGVISKINGSTSFCVVPGCQLTYTFGGLKVNANFGSGNLGYDYTNSWLKFYIDTPTSANTSLSIPTNLSQAQNFNAANGVDGTLWLSLAFNNALTVNSSGSIAQLFQSGQAFNIVGGVAMPAFIAGQVLVGQCLPTSTVDYGFGAGFDANGDPCSGFMTDSTFTTTFTTRFPAVVANQQIAPGVFAGASTFNSNSNNIPEPGTLALLGFGLLGAAAMRRRNA